MNKLSSLIARIVVKKKTRKSVSVLSRQAREQIRILKEKGIQLPIMTF